MSASDPALLDSWNTVVLSGKSGQASSLYLLGDLIAMGAARQDDEKTATLLRNVVVRAGASWT